MNDFTAIAGVAGTPLCMGYMDVAALRVAALPARAKTHPPMGSRGDGR